MVQGQDGGIARIEWGGHVEQLCVSDGVLEVLT